MSSPPDERPDPASEGSLASSATRRRIVFVAGSGRSGTSTLAGILQQLGMHVPQPEVVADATNPKGFGEPRWVVDFHDRLLRNARVQVSDARPQAWATTARLTAREPVRAELLAWLRPQFDEADELVVKDPRLSWFLPLWREAATDCGAVPCFITMLRPPAEVVASKEKYYGGQADNLNRTAAWLNMMLHTEEATRGSRRALIRYDDLLDDWTGTIMRVGKELELRTVVDADPAAIQRAHGFVDPALRRMRLTLDDLELPPRLRELTDQTYGALNALAEPGGDRPEAHHALDELRDSYVRLYAEAEAIAKSSILMAARPPARPRRQRQADRHGAATPAPTAAAPTASAPPQRTAHRLLPHRVRALVPAPVRRRARKLLGQSRPWSSR